MPTSKTMMRDDEIARRASLPQLVDVLTDPPPRNRGGRPTFEPTDEQRSLVVALVGLQVPQETIARLIGRGGIAVETLQKHFAEELQTGRERLVASLKAMVVRSAQAGSVRAQTWLLERIAGPEFAPRLRLSGEDGAAPIAITADAKVTVYLPDNGRDKPHDG